MTAQARETREGFQLANDGGTAAHMERLSANGIGDKAIEFLAASPDLLNGFLNLSGLTPDEMLAAADDNAIRVNALHYLASDEATAKAFSEAVGLKAGQLAQALAALDPHGSSAW